MTNKKRLDSISKLVNYYKSNIKNNKYTNFCLILLFIFISNLIFFKQGIINSILIFIISVIVFVRSKFSILSILIVLSNYPLLALTFQYITGESYGILEIVSHEIGLHYFEMTTCILIFNILLFFITYYTRFLKYELNFLDKRYDISPLLVNLFCFIAIAATIIYLPRLSIIPELDNPNRFYHLLPGNAWNYVAIVAVLFTTLSRRLSILQIFTYIFVIFWFFFNYERVDMLGLFILLGLRYRTYLLNLKFIAKIKYKKFIISVICGLLLIFLFASSHLREGRNVDLFMIAKDMLVQTTSCDIMHVFNTAFDYVENIGTANGQTYLSYIYKLVPGMDNNLDYSTILNDYIKNPGGGYFLTEPYMNFSYLGVILFSTGFFGFLYLLVKKSNALSYLYYACMISAIFRVMWYGLIYIHKSYIMIIPVFFIFMICFDKYIMCFLKNKKNKVKFLCKIKGE